MMKLENIYLKPMDRDIKGVIKVGQDDEANVYTELDEYVVTEELQKHFENFFESYRVGTQNQTDNIGVWISGFFGSGKSHFLKILSYALANKEVDGKTALEFFKAKIHQPKIIKNMANACEKTTDVMLFNIDAKNTTNSSNQKETILQVFNNVFNEMQGFSGITPGLADFERFLSNRGKYEDFKTNFEDIYGETWEASREDAAFIADEMVEAYIKTMNVSEESARAAVEKTDKSISLNLEAFGKRINEYLSKKTADHQIIFLVDEVGQYIGEDSKLMLNLQTIVEELGRQCHGRVWVLVTSQQDIDSVSDKVKGNDFSKIMGRFHTRLSLSSKNVDEVIRKRLLEKTEVAKQTLADTFIQAESILKNLLTFTTDTSEMKIYKNTEEFVSFYPFIPYQFHLLQQVFNGIRTRGASGKHLSEGERSLLSAFQESGIQTMDQEIGYLVPFNTFYQTIESFLEPTVVRAIAKASANERLNDFDVEVLKTLFLVKYANEVRAKKENITTLMISHIDEDKLALSQKIEASLQRLNHEALIQHNGEIYDFLTNDEQDVNREIQNQMIDSSATVKKAGDMIFNEIFTDRKYRFDKFHDFGLNKKIDDYPVGNQGNDIGVQVVTPYSGYELDTIKSLSSREPATLILFLPPNQDNYLRELELAAKIDKYAQIKRGTQMTANLEDILRRKERESQERKSRAKDYLIEALKEAKLIVNMSEVSAPTKSPKDKIEFGLGRVIKNQYHKLTLLERHFEGEADLKTLLNEPFQRSGLTSLGETEIKQNLSRIGRQKPQVTLKDLQQIFGKAPYGWRETDLLGQLILLFKDRQLNFIHNGEPLEQADRNFVNLLMRQSDRIILQAREEIPPKLIKLAKDLYKELFHTSKVSDDAETLVTDFKANLLEKKQLNSQHLNESERGNYPGTKLLKQSLSLINQLFAEKNTLKFYQLLSELEDDLAETFEDLEPVTNFYEGNQFTTFQKGFKVLRDYEANEGYLLESGLMETVISPLKSILENPSPYKQIPKIHDLEAQFTKTLTGKVQEKIAPTLEFLEKTKVSLLKFADNLSNKDNAINGINADLDLAKRDLESCHSFTRLTALEAKIEGFHDKWMKHINYRIDQEYEAKKRAQEQELKAKGALEVAETFKPRLIKKRQKIHLNTIIPRGDVLSTETDVDKLVEQIRKELKRRLNTETELEIH